MHKTIFIDASHYWPFDDVESIKDIISGKTAVIQGTASQVSKGAINGAVKLNGSSNSVSLGSFTDKCVGNFDLCVDGLTLSVWITHFLDVGEASKHTFLSLGSSSNTEKGFKIYFEPTLQQGINNTSSLHRGGSTGASDTP